MSKCPTNIPSNTIPQILRSTMNKRDYKVKHCQGHTFIEKELIFLIQLLTLFLSIQMCIFIIKFYDFLVMSAIFLWKIHRFVF
jgi:hypothetical protein